QQHQLAVLAIDPSSTRTGGSILGDKTRMQSLATHPAVYIRPSPTSGTLGGVSRMTRESILLCEAAGFDRIVIESVGVGQSEITLAAMVDFYILLMLPGAGDELQGIKKGVLEVAHLIAVNKADPDNSLAAEQAASAYRHALHIMTPAHPDWRPPVVTCSALHETGVTDIWNEVMRFQSVMSLNGAWQETRTQQQIDWMWSMFEQRLLGRLKDDKTMSAKISELEALIRNNEQTPVSACEQLEKHFRAVF
ncbi:MAG: methylmalonyl Co-A mutase-associated GTPase MeaB, partial [Gammaproteobacteria bacterium]|nr:methylmalonyl Co-A mutase-associated GTPase MeaB [Gammaproteobacteria bacterium]